MRHERRSERRRREGGRGLPEGSKEAEARGLLEKSGAGGLRKRGGELPRFSQRREEQRARRRRRERLGERRGEAIKERRRRAKEGGEMASSLPEAKSESMAKSQGEEERLENGRAYGLPWERSQSLKSIRDGREGARAPKRRREHKESAKERGDLSPLAHNTKKKRRAEALSSDCHKNLQRGRGGLLPWLLLLLLRIIIKSEGEREGGEGRPLENENHYQEGRLPLRMRIILKVVQTY